MSGRGSVTASLDERPSVRRSIRALPTWLRLLLVGQFVSAAGSLAWMYLTLYLVQARHLDSTLAGALGALNGAGLILGNLLGGVVGDRIGARRALIAGQFGWAASCAVVAWSPVFALGPILLGAGALGGSARPLMTVLAMDALPVERRRVGASVWRLAVNAGSAVGPLLGALAAGRHFWLIFAGDGVASAVLGTLAWCCVPKPVAVPRSLDVRRVRPAVKRTRSPIVVLLATAMLVDLSYRQLYVGLPLELHRLREPSLVYGATVSLNCILVVGVEMWATVKTAHRPPTELIAAGYALVGLSWIAFGSCPGVVTAFALVVVISVGEILYKPAATAAVAVVAPPGRQGTYQSFYAAASVSGTLSAPALGGFLFQYASAWLWILAASLPVAAAGWIWSRVDAAQAVSK